MRSIYALALVILFTLIAQPAPTYACSCAPQPAPLAARTSAMAVFVGTVSGFGATDASGATLLVTFEVQQTWKGPTGAQVTLATASGSANCGYEFVRGEQYLVYASAEAGQLRTSLCSRTTPLASASEDLAALGPGTPVTATAAPVSSAEFDIPWLLVAVGGICVVIISALGVGWLRRR